MGSTRVRPRGVALVLLALSAPGCVTGHLLDAARRRERPIAVHEAALDGARLLVGYTASVEDDRGRPRGETSRRAAVPVAQLRRRDLTIDAFAIERLPDGTPLAGQPLRLVGSAPVSAEGPYLELADAFEGSEPQLILHGVDPASAMPPFPASALTRVRTEPWVYPLVPLALVFDAATVPALLLLTPPLLVFGD